MKKLLLSLSIASVVFAQQNAPASTHAVADELYNKGMSIIQSSDFLKGFVYLRASCALQHKQACEELDSLIREVIGELRKLRVMPDRKDSLSIPPSLKPER